VPIKLAKITREVLIFASLAGEAGNEPDGEADDMASPGSPFGRV
jgi:hypothetical protein